MLRNLKLGTKLNLFLLLIFLVIVAISGFSLSIILENTSKKVVADKALLLIETMVSVRNYTSTQVNPELVSRLETEEEFLPQTVPAYSAREVFEDFRNNKEYNDFFYKEATLNPTNLRDKADNFETTIIEQFRNQLALDNNLSNLKEKTGFRSLSSGELFYIARPIAITQESCLRCHSTPEAAPKSQLATYGDKNGFGWNLNEIIGVQMISVPASQVFNEARSLQFSVISIISGFLLLAIIIINFFLRMTVTNPLNQMSKLAKKVSTGDMAGTFEHKANDEIGILANSLNRMKVSLEMAMNMLNSEEGESE